MQESRLKTLLAKYGGSKHLNAPDEINARP